MAVVESCIGARFCVRREVVVAVEKAATPPPPPPATQPARMAAMKGARMLIGSINGVLLCIMHTELNERGSS